MIFERTGACSPARAQGAAPTSVNVTVAKRSREYLTEREVERLIEAAKQNRSGHRDATAILVAYRHGLRASEVVALRWDDVDLTTGCLHVSFIPTCCGTHAGSSSQRWPRHSGHPSLPRPPLNHVHRALCGFDIKSVQELLERLTFPFSRSCWP